MIDKQAWQIFFIFNLKNVTQGVDAKSLLIVSFPRLDDRDEQRKIVLHPFVDFKHEHDAPITTNGICRACIFHVVDQTTLIEIVKSRVSALAPPWCTFDDTCVQSEHHLLHVDEVLVDGEDIRLSVSMIESDESQLFV